MTTTEITPKYLVEFPDYGILDVTIPIGFEDASWRNDACPCWINDELHLRLMIDYARRSKSTVDAEPIGPYLRFMVDWLTEDNQVSENHAGSVSFATYDEALAVIIGVRFARLLAEDMTHAEWLEMRRLNATPKYAAACASQDFCDANMTMQEAMVELGVLDPDADLDGDWASENTPESQRLVALWNAAWDDAKARYLTAND